MKKKLWDYLEQVTGVVATTAKWWYTLSCTAVT